MRLDYYPETDSLYIDLADRPSAETIDAGGGVLLDFDDEGALVGIDIDHASNTVDLKTLDLSGLFRRSGR